MVNNIYFYWSNAWNWVQGDKMRVIYILIIVLIIMISFQNGQGSLISNSLINEKINVHTQIYALNLSLPEVWGVYGFYNYSLSGKNYSINISNITDSYYLNLNISYQILVLENSTIYYNLTLFPYKLQDYIALNSLSYKGKFNVSIEQKEYNLTLNASAIKFENVNNFYYFWNQYGYKVIGSILIIGLFLFFISRLRRVR